MQGNNYAVVLNNLIHSDLDEMEADNVIFHKYHYPAEDGVYEIIFQEKNSNFYVSISRLNLVIIMKDGKILFFNNALYDVNLSDDEIDLLFGSKKHFLEIARTNKVSDYSMEILYQLAPFLNNPGIQNKFHKNKPHMISTHVLQEWMQTAIDPFTFNDPTSVIFGWKKIVSVGMTSANFIYAETDFRSFIIEYVSKIENIITHDDAPLDYSIRNMISKYYDLMDSLNVISDNFTYDQLKKSKDKLEKIFNQIPDKSRNIKVTYVDRYGIERTVSSSKDSYMVANKMFSPYGLGVFIESVDYPFTHSWIRLTTGGDIIPLQHIKKIVHRNKVIYEQ